MEDKVQTQVLFTITDPDSGVNFIDALYYDPATYARLSIEEVEAAKQERFDNWKTAIITLPPKVSTEDRIAAIDEQIEQLNQQKDQLQAEES